VSDDRPALDPVEALAALQRRVDDFESTTAARMLRRPTGTVEPWIWPNPLPGTLLLQGQTLSRATYPDLWRVVQERGGVTSGVFGAGDGSTTFVLPDLRGRTLVGADATNPLGAKFGAATVTLTTANMPAHWHANNFTTGSDAHSHSGSTGTSGNHDRHIRAQEVLTNGAPPGGIADVANYFGQDGGLHSHSFTTGSDTHSHSVTGDTGTTGSGAAFDVRQPSFSANAIIWT
jgi:microcystin-dependent protein